jgi:hypothetical protein
MASCPVESHGQQKGDRNPSLSLWDDDKGRLAYNCLGNCAHSDVRDALISKGVLSRDDGWTPKPKPPVKPLAQTAARPVDEWEPVALDTPGAPTKLPEDVLIGAGVLGRVDIHRVARTDPTRCIIAEKLVSVLS